MPGLATFALTFYTMGINIAYLLVALVIARVVLAYLDKSLGVKFNDDAIFGKIAASSTACAIYYGIRFFAVCYVAASLIR